MKKPHWQDRFLDLPEIPNYKKWNNSQLTIEQQIALKLINKEEISSHEKKIFETLLEFYKTLDNKLSSLDYKAFTDSDFIKFKNYLFYAFNYKPLISNDLTIFSTYRLVINENVIQSNTRIKHIDFLKYPTRDIVKNIGKYNRANTPDNNLFYSSENIDTTLKEIRLPKNKLITVGIWKSVNNKKFNSYPISHSELAKKNVGVVKATLALEKLKDNTSSLLIEYIENYLKLMGREFTKQISHHFEYYISSLFAERVLFNQKKDNDFIFDCIIYPSVGNNFNTDNIAMLPSVVDKYLKLDQVIEFEIENTYYDDPSIADDPEDITLADIKNVSTTSNIDEFGNIIW